MFQKKSRYCKITPLPLKYQHNIAIVIYAIKLALSDRRNTTASFCSRLRTLHHMCFARRLEDTMNGSDVELRTFIYGTRCI